VPETLLGLLKLCLLVLVYLFFARVLWAVWSEVKAGGPRTQAAGVATDSTNESTSRPGRHRPARSKHGPPGRLVGVQPPAIKGAVYLLTGEMSIGRSTGCAIHLPQDTFLSSVHARTYVESGTPYIEDLQSTNGTYVNGARIATPMKLFRGDRVQVGSTLLEVD
jgi:FHA domain